MPLGIAFVLSRRAASRRYTYGYGRAEDLAAILIVATIAASAALAAWAAIDRLLSPRDSTHLWAVAAAAAASFAGAESVARYRIRTGRRIGSAALVADSLHARTDGFTSLAVLFGVDGAALGWRYADPMIGLLSTAATLFVLKDAVREVYERLMDSVDPHLVQTAEHTLRILENVRGIGQVRMRWIGHALSRAHGAGPGPTALIRSTGLGPLQTLEMICPRSRLRRRCHPQGCRRSTAYTSGLHAG